jgi:subtilisin family serine protease
MMSNLRLTVTLAIAVVALLALGLPSGSGPVPLHAQGGVGIGTAPLASATGEAAVPGELIVKFKPGASRSDQAAAIQGGGATEAERLLLPDFTLVRVPEGKEREAAAQLKADPRVELVEPNAIGWLDFVPNDTYYPYQWHLPQIQMPQAWDLADGTGVTVAVLDSGVAYENYGGFAKAPDLGCRTFVNPRDFVNADYHPNDDHGHGTHVTGTIAECTNNDGTGSGVAGVAFDATIMPVKVCSAIGQCDTSDVIEGIMWATNNGADVINLSLGGSYTSAEKVAIDYALAHDVVVVAAAGNGGLDEVGDPVLNCPACYPGVIAVGATDFRNVRTPYSNYGTGVSGHTLDLVAPGGDIYRDDNSDSQPDGVLQETFDAGCGGSSFTSFVPCWYEGTSMATPHVAGAAALLREYNPSLTRTEVANCLTSTALDRGTAGYDLQYGYGLVQVRDALEACGDSDGDGVLDGVDNCPATYNPGQENNVHPATPAGDACEDYDSDGVYDDTDNCPDAPNPGQGDADGDGVGDACDNCPADSNPDQIDTDDDTLGDVCDPDDDNDGIDDGVDNCPLVANPGQEDSDGDGVGDACEPGTGYDPRASCDFDGDGFDDLAVGAPGEDVGAIVDAGAVNVLYGSSSALTGVGDQLWHQGIPAVTGGAENGDHFGGALSCGDYDGDGFDDLAIGAPGEDVGAIADAGAVNVLYGSSSGLTGVGDQLWYQGLPGVLGAAEGGDGFGSALSSGDYDGDGFDDLAIGAPGEDVGATMDAGAVNVLYGSLSGLTAIGDQLWQQGAAGVLGAAEAGDRFSDSLASGDYDGDGIDDVAIGAPGEDVGAIVDAGAVNVLYGSLSGLTGVGDQLWQQGAAGVLGAAEAGDHFSDSLASGDYDGDGIDDLAIGAPQEDVGAIVDAGAVNVLYGSLSGLTGIGDQLWQQGAAGVLGAAEAGDRFGDSLGSGDYDGDGSNDLAIGAPQEDVGAIVDAGAVNVLYGSLSGLTGVGDQLWQQGAAGVTGGAEAGDAFGVSLG